MLVMIWFFALYLVVIGLMTLGSPDVIRRMSRWFMTPMRIRVSTVISIALGVAVFMGRLETKYPMLVGLFGLLIAVTSVIYLVLPWRMQERINEWSVNLSDAWYRIFAVIYVLIGAGLTVSLVR
ncbi:MAG: hypothetical protein NTU88_01960 [Armatimonadetes bacterium]|nr:hypothetical protein [Armatimonadota bacterium]